jgi:hypothetical protein
MSRKTRTLLLKAKEKQELIDHRDHDPRAYVRERCSAIGIGVKKRLIISMLCLL